MPETSARVRFARRIAQGDPSLRLYAILDAGSCRSHGLDLVDVANTWHDAGISLLQYRDKSGDPSQIIQNALRIRALFDPAISFLILNDHVSLVEETGFDGVHIGQNDATVKLARTVIGGDRILGVSTHSVEQVQGAETADIDYVAIGPVFPTVSKDDAEPAVGICGVQAAKALTRKPLVAIGGVTLASAHSVRRAGADTVAMISALLKGRSVSALTETAQDFFAALK